MKAKEDINVIAIIEIYSFCCSHLRITRDFCCYTCLFNQIISEE